VVLFSFFTGCCAIGEVLFLVLWFDVFGIHCQKNQKSMKPGAWKNCLIVGFLTGEAFLLGELYCLILLLIYGITLLPDD
jgi:tellurite resistance protein TehA-like permease